jgi:hypothetical protein
MGTEPQEPITPAIQGITEEELQLIFSGPAVFANKVFVTIAGPVARITFMDLVGDTLHFRTAAMVALNDLLSLRDVISGLADKVKVVEVGPQQNV